MNWPFYIAKYLDNVIAKTARSLDAFDDSFESDLRPADARFGEFQANGVLPYAKRKE